MASVQIEKNGRALIQFIGPDKRRRKIRLGKMSERNAERFAERLEQLITCAKHGVQLESDLVSWVGKLGDDLAEKFATYGLIARRESTTIGKMIEAYLSQRVGVKKQTVKIQQQAQKALITFFGYDRDIRTITPGDADAFAAYLRRPKPEVVAGREVGEPGAGLAEATARRHCGRGRQFFRFAMRNRVIAENPFAGISGAVKSNKARMRFITLEEFYKVINACANAEERLIFALSRIGGLRTPSEHNGLRWSDVNWEESKFLVHSPKTEHHEGNESRWVPIFPELRPYLEEVFHDPDGSREFVIGKYRSNLRNRFTAIIKRAGLTPWPKIFQNLRSSRQTELAATFPLHIVCAWLGNKAAVAAEHYLTVTDSDFAKATQTRSEAGAIAGHHSATHDATGYQCGPMNPAKGQPMALCGVVCDEGEKYPYNPGVVPSAVKLLEIPRASLSGEPSSRFAKASRRLDA